MDAKMLSFFEDSVVGLTAMFGNCERIPIRDAVGMLKEIDELIDHGKGLGPQAHDLLTVLEASSDALLKLIEGNVIEGDREGFRHSRSIIQRLNQFRRHQAYIDVFRGEPGDRLPTLLCFSTEDLRFLFQELPPDFADVASAWQNTKEELRSFAIGLIRDSTEAKSKLLKEPDKL